MENYVNFRFKAGHAFLKLLNVIYFLLQLLLLLTYYAYTETKREWIHRLLL